MSLNHIVGYVVIGLGILFMFFGMVAMIKFKNFFTRLLCATKIDTVAMITIFFGLIIYNGFSITSVRLAILLTIVLFLNPLVTHIMAQLAYASGYRIGVHTNGDNETVAEKIDSEALDFADNIVTEEQTAKHLYDINE